MTKADLYSCPPSSRSATGEMCAERQPGREVEEVVLLKG